MGSFYNCLPRRRGSKLDRLGLGHILHGRNQFQQLGTVECQLPVARRLRRQSDEPDSRQSDRHGFNQHNRQVRGLNWMLTCVSRFALLLEWVCVGSSCRQHERDDSDTHILSRGRPVLGGWRWGVIHIPSGRGGLLDRLGMVRVLWRGHRRKQSGAVEWRRGATCRLGVESYKPISG